MRSSVFRFSLLWIVICCFGMSPQQDFKLITEIACNADDISTDDAGNIYIVEGDVLTKYSAAGIRLCSYSNKLLGSISSIDVSGTLVVMVFYTNPGKALFLDNNLTIIRDPMKMPDLGLDDARLSCLSSEKGFWVYDAQKDAITRISINTQSILTETGLLSQALGEKVEPQRILESGDKLFLLTRSGRLYNFDHFGTYLGQLDISGVRSFQVNDNKVFYLDSAGTRIDWMTMKTFERGNIALPEDSALSFRYDAKKIFLQYPRKLSVYGLSGD